MAGAVKTDDADDEKEEDEGTKEEEFDDEDEEEDAPLLDAFPLTAFFGTGTIVSTTSTSMAEDAEVI